LVLACSLAACGDDEPREHEILDAAVGDESALYAADDFDAGSCDPNALLPGAATCPPLREDREPTAGPIPEGAFTDAGTYDETRIPDFIPALDHGGSVAGYVRWCAIRTGGAIPVYADNLKTVVGHMIPNKGFVPGALQ
jgi:hypothetical protein